LGDEQLNGPLLLDTHTLLWAVAAPDQLGGKAVSLLADPQVDRSISAATCLEIARLNRYSQISLSLPPNAWISGAVAELRLRDLPISSEIAIEAYALPEPFHRDPADRLLVATARLLKHRIMTADERILAYPYVTSVDCRK
jgi:PIN domain nuclease of toxin-antitoxin system